MNSIPVIVPDPDIILDSRDPNMYFRSMVLKENIKRLTVSHFIIVPKKLDRDCADITNKNGDGMIELKTYADFVNSTTGDKVHRLEDQVIDMYATGFPFAVVIYGNRYIYQKISGVSDATILSGLQKLMSLSAIFKFTVIFVNDEYEAFEVSRTFLKKCRELPRGRPIYNYLQDNHEGLTMLCGIKGIGPVKARLVMKVYSNVINLIKKILKLIEMFGIDKSYTKLAELTPGLGNAKAKLLINALLEDYK